MAPKKSSKPSQTAKPSSLAGGGNTIAAINEYGLTKKIGYISTAGGALIEFLMGKKLPGVVALETAIQDQKNLIFFSFLLFSSAT